MAQQRDAFDCSYVSVYCTQSRHLWSTVHWIRKQDSYAYSVKSQVILHLQRQPAQNCCELRNAYLVSGCCGDAASSNSAVAELQQCSSSELHYHAAV
jgi:hypothetical protein